MNESFYLFFKTRRNIKEHNYITFANNELWWADNVWDFTPQEGQSFQDMVYKAPVVEVDLIYYPGGYWK